MTDVPRWPQGAKKAPSHFELEKQGWHRGDPTTKVCKICGQTCEWWGKPERVEWKLFNFHMAQMHSETCQRAVGVWESDRDHLRNAMDAEITKRRIQKISFNHDGKALVAEIEKPNPYNGLPVRAIYEDGKRGCFLICGGDVTIAPKDSLVEDQA